MTDNPFPMAAPSPGLSPEPLPSNWEYCLEGYKRKSHDPYGTPSLRMVFGQIPEGYVREVFGRWSAYTRSGYRSPWEPFMEGLTYPNHMAAIIAAELELSAAS